MMGRPQAGWVTENVKTSTLCYKEKEEVMQ